MANGISEILQSKSEFSSPISEKKKKKKKKKNHRALCSNEYSDCSKYLFIHFYIKLRLFYFIILFKGVLSKKSTFLKNWHPVRGPMSFAAKEKNKQIK